MDTLFFVAGKVAGLFLRVETWLILALMAALVALFLRRQRLAIGMLAAALSVLIVLALFPLGSFMLRPLENRFAQLPPLEQISGIIILGGAEHPELSQYHDQVQLGEAAERYTQALALARRFPEAQIVITGGSGKLRGQGVVPVSEAEIGLRFFLEQGVSRARITLEEASRNTAENAARARDMVGQVEGKWVLVTSAFHMPRAMRSFGQADWPELVAFPVDYRAAPPGAGSEGFARELALLNTALREHLGRLAYRLVGR